MRKVLFWLLLGYCLVQTTYGQTNGQQAGTSLNVCGATTSQGSVPAYNGGSLPGSCLSAGALNPFWYTFDIATNGTLGFTIVPNNGGDDYDFALFDITGHAASDVFTNSGLVVSCNYSGYTGTTGLTATGSGNSNGANGPNQNALLPVVAGHTYALVVSHYTSSNQSGYSLNFTGGTATLAPPTPPEFASSVNVCNKYLSIKTDRSIKCSTIAANGSDFVLQPGNIPLPGATGLGCSSSSFTNEIQVLLPATLTNGTTYTLFAKTGTDGNSLQDVCGLDLNPASTLSVPYTTAPPVVGDFTINNVVQCQTGNNFVFTNISTVLSGTLTYQWNLGDGTTATTQDATRSYGSANTYNVTMIATSDRLCKDTVQKTVTVNPVKRTTESHTICITELPYLWRGKTVTTGGATAAYDTLPSLVTGCDSIITLNLTVNPLKTATINTTVCEDQLPYTWHGQTVTVTGNSTLTFTTPSLITGCDSTTTLNLTVNPFKTMTETITICINQLPYTWNGQTIVAGGTGVATDTRPSLLTGCDSTTTLDLIVNPLKTTVLNLALCPNQLPYTWHGQTVNTVGNSVLTFTTTSLLTGCDSTTTLNLTVNPNKTETISQTICADQLPFTWNGQTVNTVGGNVLTFTTASLLTGCDSTVTLNLTVNPLKSATQSITICADQLPFVWNGISVPAGGNGVATYHTPSLLTDCDSTVILNLTVNPLKSATQSITICADQLPYTWHGTSVSAGGNGVATYHTPSLLTGCDSTTTLNLTVNPLKSVIQAITICANQLPYTWNGQSIAAGGNGVATYHTPSLLTGCDSTTTLNLVVNPLKFFTINMAICANQLPYTWHGQTVNTIGNTILTYHTPSLLTGCDSTTTLNLTVNPLKTAAVSITICANQLPFVWNGQTVTATGLTTLTYTTPSLITGCDSTTTLNLTVNVLPAVTVSPAPQVVIVGDNATFSVTVTGTGPLTYQWEVNSGTGFTPLASDAVYSNVASATLTITHAVYNMNGYQYRCVVSGMCTPPAISSAATLTVNKKAQAISFQNSQAIAGIITTTYGDGQQDGSAIASSGLPVSYSSNNINVATVNNNGVVYLYNAGTATITVTQAGNDEYLPAPDAVVVVQVNKKDLDIIADDKTRPYGESNPSLTFHYTGFVNNDTKFAVTAPSITTTAILTSVPGSYPITLTGGSAANYNIVLKDGTLTVTGAVVVVNQQPLNKAVCENGMATFSTGASARSQIVTLSYQWQESTDGVQWSDVPGETGVTYNATAITTGYVRCMILAIGTAQPTNTARFTVYPLPYVRATKANDLDCNTGTSQLYAYGASKFTWAPATGLDNVNNANPIASPLKATKYVVTGTDVNGCVNKDSVTIEILTTKVGENEMANAFTPNGDGRNDCFGIRFWGVVEQLDFSIFNRAGVRVFHTNNPGQCWDGRYQGQEQPIGTYVYIIKAVNNCGPIERKGTVVLMR
ncbi:MAG: gliding motility-associated C-terminal domain-containing protein [Filimonas sp.]|nr:gliding motility-associated C-terminal domain-containing protein [Filimonas sp.]